MVKLLDLFPIESDVVVVWGVFYSFLMFATRERVVERTLDEVVICEQREVLMSVFGPFIQVHEVTCKGVDTGKSHPLRATLLGVSGLAPLMDFITCMGHPLNCRYYMLQPCADAQIRTKSEVITQTLQQVFSECYVICNVVFEHINCRGCPLCDCGTAQKACLLKCKILFLYSTLCY